jgi:chromosome segregation ATPase
MSVSTICTSHTNRTQLQQSLEALRNRQEDYGQFVAGLLADMGAMHERLIKSDTQLSLQRQQLSDLHSPLAEEFQQLSSEKQQADEALQQKVTELEGERQALEEELENIRARAVEMSQVIAEQKRQMSEDQSQWMAELRQLRRILDKQTKLITQQTELGMFPGAGTADGRNALSPVDQAAAALQLTSDENGASHGRNSNGSNQAQRPAARRGSAATNADPVLGSVLSQFEILQKDVARRRKQTGSDQNGKT